MPRVVLDTNVLVSAFLKRGSARAAILVLASMVSFLTRLQSA